MPPIRACALLPGAIWSEQGAALIHREAADRDNIPFYLQLVGSISEKKHVMGIPYQALEALTTFDEAKTIMNQMNQRDIDNIKLKYAGWFNGGLDHKVPDPVSVDECNRRQQGAEGFGFIRQDKALSFSGRSATDREYRCGFRLIQIASRTLKRGSGSRLSVRFGLEPAGQ